MLAKVFGFANNQNKKQKHKKERTKNRSERVNQLFLYYLLSKMSANISQKSSLSFYLLIMADITRERKKKKRKKKNKKEPEEKSVTSHIAAVVTVCAMHKKKI